MNSLKVCNFLLSTLLAYSVFAANSITRIAPSCGSHTSAKYIQLRQPPSQPPPRKCRYYIEAYNKNVCQLRIDFTMTLAQPSKPDVDGNGAGLWYVQCVRDYFQVNDMKFCGTETAQHIYVPYKRTAAAAAAASALELTIVLAKRSEFNGSLPAPQWNMLVTQLECLQGVSALREQKLFVGGHEDTSLLLAPAGCLQYFPDSTGTIVSFNYAGGKGVYTGNFNYAICFRRQQTKQQLKIHMHYFSLGAEHSRQKFNELDHYCRPQLHSEGLSEDYLLIPQAVIEESNIRATYFCGNSIQGDTVISHNPGPLMLIFNSDGNYKAEREVGFALNYVIV